MKGYDFPLIWGEKCVTSLVHVLEIGMTVSFDSETMISDLTDVGGCKLKSGHCETKHGTLVWDVKNITRPCPFKMIGTYPATISPPHVLMKTKQLGLLLDRNLTISAPCPGMDGLLHKLVKG